MLPVEPPFKTYTGLDGKPLDNGYVYFGQPDQNPITAPVTVYWDAAGTIPAAQPLRTVGGYIMRVGSPANVFFDGPYSELVQDSKGRQVFYARTSDEFSIVSAVANFIKGLADNAGASLLGFIQAGVGAVKRTAQDKLRESVSVKDFGAVGDGTDDTAAFLAAAAASAGKSVYVPAGEYVLTAAIASDAVHWHGDGLRTRIVFTHGGDGFVFTPTLAESTSGCKHMAIYCKGANGGSAIKTPYAANQYTDLRSAFEYEGLLIAGYTKPAAGTNNAFETIETWLCGIEQGDAWNIGLREVDCYGSYRSDTDPSSQVKSCFIRLSAASAMLTAHISNFTCANVYRGVEIGDRCFFQISNFDIAHAFDGVYQISATPNVYGESKLLHGNINAQHFGVYFQDIGTREISGVVVRRHKYGWKGATYDWAGIRLVNCNYVWLSDCQVQPDASAGAFPGTAYAVQLVECGGVSAIGTVVGGAMDRGFLLDGCLMTIIDATKTYQNADTDILFRAINNTRTSRIGSYVRVSTFVGTDYSDDGSITPGSIQQTQRNVIPEGTAPSYFYRRASNAVDEKIWKTTIGASSWALQMSNDAETVNTNAMIFNRSGSSVTSVDIRTAQLKLANGPTINVGAGSPEGSVTAIVGSTYQRTLGAASTTLYIKESGTGNTGWRAV